MKNANSHPTPTQNLKDSPIFLKQEALKAISKYVPTPPTQNKRLSVRFLKCPEKFKTVVKRVAEDFGLSVEDITSFESGTHFNARVRGIAILIVSNLYQITKQDLGDIFQKTRQSVNSALKIANTMVEEQPAIDKYVQSIIKEFSS